MTRRGTGDAADPITVGMHYQRAGVWDRAVVHLHEAARLAVERFAYRDAVAASEAALEAVSHLPAERVSQARAFELRMLLAFSLVFLSEYARALEHYDAAAQAAEAAGRRGGSRPGPRRAGDRLRLSRAVRRGAGDGRAGAGVGRAAHRPHRPGLGVRGAGARLLPHRRLPGLRAPRSRHDELSAELARRPDHDGPAPASAAGRTVLARCQPRHSGRVRGGIRRRPGDARRGRAARPTPGADLRGLRPRDRPPVPGERRRGARDPRAAARAVPGRGVLGVLRAHRVGARGRPCARRASGRRRAAAGTGGRPYLLDPLSQRQLGAPGRSRRGLPAGGPARRRAADGPGGARRWLASWESAGTKPWRVARWGRRWLSRDPPDVAGAETHFGQALVLAEELSMRPTAARCHLGLGALYRRAGHPDRARAELALAAEAFRALGMASWLTRAEAELGQLDPAASAGTSLPTGVVESLGADAHAHAGSREDAGGASEDRSDQHGVPSR